MFGRLWILHLFIHTVASQTTLVAPEEHLTEAGNTSNVFHGDVEIVVKLRIPDGVKFEDTFDEDGNEAFNLAGTISTALDWDWQKIAYGTPRTSQKCELPSMHMYPHCDNGVWTLVAVDITIKDDPERGPKFSAVEGAKTLFQYYKSGNLRTDFPIVGMTYSENAGNPESHLLCPHLSCTTESPYHHAIKKRQCNCEIVLNAWPVAMIVCLTVFLIAVSFYLIVFGIPFKDRCFSASRHLYAAPGSGSALQLNNVEGEAQMLNQATDEFDSAQFQSLELDEAVDGMLLESEGSSGADAESSRSTSETVLSAV